MGTSQLPSVKTAFFAAAAFCLSACAGGSTSGPVSPAAQIPTTAPSTNFTPAPPTANPNSFRTAAYLRIGVLDAVNAANAYALGYTGQGVTIGIVDFNFVFNSNQVNFSPASRGPNLVMQALYAAQTGSAPTTDQHGQAVAVTAAGNGTGIQGLAFNSQVLAVDYFSDVNDTQVTQNGVRYHVSDPWTYITSHGVRIINTSYGYEASDIIPASQLPKVSQGYVLASPATAVQNGALLVSSAGNAGGSQPSQSNLDTISQLQSLGILNSGPGAFIIAGAVDQNNQIASFSDRAGSYSAYYMVAPGVNLTLPWNGGYALVSGTSFSAPLISAAAAIVMQRWPNLTARQVADILEQSATPLGPSSTYGYGMLNVYAALQPVGTTTVAVTNGIAPTVTSSGLVLGPAFGDAPMLHQALAQVMILDSFGRDFETDMSKAIIAQPALPDLFGVMEQRFGWYGGGFDLGRNTFVSLSLRSNPEDGILPLQATGGLAGQLQHQSTFRLTGEQDGFFWMAGSGMSLRQGMMPDGDDPFISDSITYGFLPLIGSPAGNFAAAGFALDSRTKLTFGIGEAQNQGLPNISLPYHNGSELASLRLDYEQPGWRFSFDAGSSFDSGAFFGSLASGALTMANEDATTWMSGTGEIDLNRTWTLKGTATLAVAGATHPAASLITSIGPVLASSFAFGLAGRDIFQDGDVLLFTVSQPMRAEYGVATLVTGIGRDWSTGGVVMGQAQASLAPSGREIDFESGYGRWLGNWRLQANAGFAFDEDHTRGKNAILSLVTLSHPL